MEGSQAPLIADRQIGEDSDDVAEGDTHDGWLAKDAVTDPGIFVVALTVAAGISGLLFGCQFAQP